MWSFYFYCGSLVVPVSEDLFDHFLSELSSDFYFDTLSGPTDETENVIDYFLRANDVDVPVHFARMVYHRCDRDSI